MAAKHNRSEDAACAAKIFAANRSPVLELSNHDCAASRLPQTVPDAASAIGCREARIYARTTVQLIPRARPWTHRAHGETSIPQKTRRLLRLHTILRRVCCRPSLRRSERGQAY